MTVGQRTKAGRQVITKHIAIRASTPHGNADLKFVIPRSGLACGKLRLK
jgi:hypothetical protein